MKSLSLIIGAVIVILLLSGVLSAVNSFRSTEIEAAYDVTTDASTNTTSIILAHELFGDNTVSAVVASNITVDAPIPFSYTSSTKTLLVTGLEVSETRRLTIDYLTDGLWDYPGASLTARMWPLMIGLGIIGLVVAAVIAATRRGE